MTEDQAIRLCLRHRDPVGFEFLVRQYRREAFMHAVALMGNPDDAADACQESFSRAFAAMPGLDGLTGFYPWFYRILRNHCLNTLSRWRTSARYARSELEDPQRGIESNCPASLLEKQEAHASVRQALERLQPEFREILLMKYFQGHSYEEIAGLIGIPRGTVMSRLYHARKAFRSQYLALTAYQTLNEEIRS